MLEAQVSGESRTVTAMRAAEFGYLDDGQHVYLDHTGAGLPPRSLLQGHVERITGNCFGNPHSENPTSMASSELLSQARAAVLRHFNADPAEYAVVFTPNASGALRLVGEAYPFSRGNRLVLSADNHNSVNGIREYARAAHAKVVYVPLNDPELRVDERDLFDALPIRRRRPCGLLAYPAQSNFTGVQHPLEWVAAARARGYDVLLDAAAFAPTNPLDLSLVQPDFTVVSWYKVFGYPTGVGSLIARKEALARLRRPWFAGGTIRIVSALAQWHLLADDETAFEDGTVNFLSIPDVSAGLEWIDGIGLDAVHAHVMELTDRLLTGLRELRHSSGLPMVRFYGPASTERRGVTVALNFLDRDGRVVDERIVTRDSARLGISLRAGCFCNPGAGEAALSLTLQTLRSSMRRPFHTMDEFVERLGLPSAGAIRVSPGLATNTADVDAFLQFARHAYRDRIPDTEGLIPRLGC
ncbi:aminotransferase class V-fold PLP-dependent enzyme [Streptomyces sp. NBC_01092]|uniref:aminotransferase class V-fold PLP-dependent enzyme n=1 Tax=Streptomyces sp. NBC_01092 TaxID=2903748 RepID=UPI00386BE057|nr:aminotransferase class V-fold PLP-dependent enzyme [Streptomyces sp. NBC_01092]